MPDTEVVLEGAGFPEAPRWRDGRLWFSDLQRRRVLCLDPDTGTEDEVVAVPGVPSGLGWDALSRLLVVSMRDRRLLRREGSGLVEVVDLSGLGEGPCNDMAVDRAGHAYVGSVGYDFYRDEPPRPTVLIMVDADGVARTVADNLWCPNGAAFLTDGTLVVAETLARRLTAFDVAADGSLGGRRVWAALGTARPDGIAVDREGGCWVATVGSPEVLRVVEGGAVTDRVVASQPAVACALGGPAGATLYVCTAPGSSRDHIDRRAGRLERAQVAVAAAIR
jgi:sugar lactone lactonase YvrE